jgi:deoxyribodipyrimidine photo-lyase
MTGALFEDTAASLFPPTLAAAQARLAAVRPGDYARSRNHLQGAVTRLSPYITHGFLSLPQVLRAVLQRQPLDLQHKFIYELAWREYFHHVWQHEGDGILGSFHEGPLPEAAYARELPADIRQARTGIPVIDQAVRTLYATGWLHNHARMWLASYVVHLRKVHWRSGADWLYGHLLDGDLASNHLSWQWVAGTGSHKPYLFNAENVARYAPAEWHSPGTVIDCSYDQLTRMAHSPRACLPQHAGTLMDVDEPALMERPEKHGFTSPDPAAVTGRTVHLVHPWCLGESRTSHSSVVRVGIVLQDFHRAWPWNAARWQFVVQRLQQSTDLLWCGDAAELQAAFSVAQSVDGVQDPHIGGLLQGPVWVPREHLFTPLALRCRSFSQYWNRVTRGLKGPDELASMHINAGATAE